MAIKIKFDLVGNPEPPTIILANRNGNKLGQLKVNEDSIELTDKFNDASEISFTVNKYIDGKLTPLWDKLVDFKLIYCKEWDLWFEAKVELDEETESVKTVFCIQLGQAELSQIMLHNIEINTEKDIERDDYKISILWDSDDPKSSILYRLLEKAPHYSIAHVDSTIKDIQRTFSFDGITICDAFQEIAKEIGCLFVYNSNSSDGGKIQRTISVYDLQQNCNECGHRGDYTGKCPKCESTDIKYGYGKDTLIFVTSDELASGGIQLTTDTDSVKNCFKLEAGDDLMTATVRNCNPNGSDYIWRFSDTIKEDMSDELVEKINSYDAKFKEYYNDYESKLNTTLVNKYNALVDKYSEYNEDLQSMDTSVKGYSNLMNAYYNTIDLALYLKSSLMPSVEMSDTDAEEQAALLTKSALSPVAVNTEKLSSVSLTTANSAVLSMAKIIVRSTYKVEINTSSISDDKKTWTGSFIVTNYSDEEDTATSGTVDVTINNDNETFIKQKLEKALNKEDTDDYSISGLFEKEINLDEKGKHIVDANGDCECEFCAELKKYALNPLKRFYDACDACIDILIDKGASDKKENPDLYSGLYLPYYRKSSAIAKEIKLREKEIAVIEGVWDTTDENNPKLKTKGLQYYIEKCRNTIQENLDFEKHLGEELSIEFCSYRREDIYSNSNYISDGLNNSELFERALEFIEVAENEIYKASELQYSISTNLNNLLSIDKFKPLVDSFEVGNWIRVQVNDEIFKLRLLEYKIDFSSFENIPVEFSDVTKIKNGITDIESILSQASSIASSYDSIQRQVKQGEEVKGTVDQWLEKGLNSALVRIKGNNSEEVTMSNKGILCRSYDDITETYAPEQFRITHNIMAYTTDDWETVSSALGKHLYNKWNGKNFVEDVGYGLSSTFVTAGYITGSQIIGGEIISSNYKIGESGTYFDLINGDFEIAGGNIVYDTKDKALTLKNVTIEWGSATKPEIEDISGLEEYLEQLEDIENQLDGRAQTWYQDTDPSIEWKTDSDKRLHIGDLWHYTGETGKVNNVERIKNSEWIWGETGETYQWSEIEISDMVFDLIDGKAQIFTATPPKHPIPPYYIGDLWVQGVDGDILHCVTSREKGKSYSEDDWVKSSKYTDDKKADDAYILADGAKSIADNAKIIGDKLVKGLGFQETEITGEYVISPVIAGGTLLIGDKTGTYAQITTSGKLYATGAEISGIINATEGGNIGGWSIGSSLIYKNKYEEAYDKSYSAAMRSNSTMAFAVYEKSGEHTGAPSISDDWKYNFYVSYAGKLFSNNAEITGTITATSGEIGGCTIKDGVLQVGSANITGTITGKTISGGSITIGDNFNVNTDGKLVASGADITGKITANSGSITGNLTIGGALSHTNEDKTYSVTLRGVQSNVEQPIFYIKDISNDSYPFYVRGNGAVVAKDMTITGGSITLGGTTLSEDSTIFTASKTKVGNQSLSTYIKDLAVGTLTAEYINSKLVDAELGDLNLVVATKIYAGTDNLYVNSYDEDLQQYKDINVATRLKHLQSQITDIKLKLQSLGV